MYLLTVALMFIVESTQAGNILVLNPLHGHSHVRLLGNIADLLAADGHNVVSLTQQFTVLSISIDPGTRPYDHKNPAIRRILFKSSYLSVDGLGNMELKSEHFWNTPEPTGMAVSWSDWGHLMESFRLIYKGLLEDIEIMRSLEESKFDLGVTELFDLMSMGVFEVLNVKSAMVAGAVGMMPWHFEIAGIPYFPSFSPSFHTTFGENMSFWERILNLKAYSEYQIRSRRQQVLFNELFREYYPNTQNLMEVAKKKTGVILTNANEFTEPPMLRSNLIQYIGGTNVHPTKPLDKEISDILNLRPQNVFFSFGTFTNICNMPLKKKTEILDAFAQLPNVTFLWKHEKCDGNEMSLDDYPNVVRRGWWPQSDLLGDPRLNAFITHAGMNSVTEALFRGIPTITIPLFADQYTNAKTAENRGISVMIKRTELNQETLVDALNKVLDRQSPIAQNAKRAAAVMKGKDEEYRQAVLKWANLLIEYGPQEHLYLPSRNLSFVEVYSLDILTFVTFIVTLLLYTLICVYRSFSLVVKLKTL